MPLKDWNQKSTWDAAYSFGAEGEWGHPNTRDEVRLHYHRGIKRPDADTHASRLASALGWTPPSPTILIVGAGFGWTVEALEDQGFLTVVAIDTSTFVQGNKDSTEEAEIDAEITLVGLDPASGRGAQIKAKYFDGGNRSRASRGVLDEEGNNGGSRSRIKQALGLSGNDQIEWVVSEAVLESLDDAEAVDGSTRLHIIGDNIAHFIHPLRQGNHPGFNWKTLEDWKTLLPNDTFIEAGTYRVL